MRAVRELHEYFVWGLVFEVLGKRFPYQLLELNVFGSVVGGLLVTLFENQLRLGHTLRLVVVLGFCGMFTTFFFFSLEEWDRLRELGLVQTGLGVLGHMTGLFAGVLMGIYLGRKLLERHAQI